MRAACTILVLNVFALVLAAPLAAQVCSGHSSLDGSLASIAVGSASYSFATARGGALTLGRNLFGTIGVERTHDADLDASALEVGVLVGYERAVPRERGARVCPVASVAVVYGPQELWLRDNAYRRIDAGAGVRIGGVASRTPNVSLIPSVGLAVHRSRRTLTQYFLHEHQTTETVMTGTYALLALDVGVVVRELLTIRPGISIPFGFAPDHYNGAQVYPFGRTDRELSFGIVAALRVPMPGR